MGSETTADMTSTTGEKPALNLSVVVPFFNEEESIGPLHQALCEALDPTGLTYELVFVDDGSTDQTFAAATALAKQDPNLTAIKLRRNAGQTPAMMSGIDYAQGAIIATMDGDLQNDPADLPLLIEMINSGYDIVVGWRHNRQDKLITRKIPSKIANWIIAKITGVAIRDNGCSLKAYRREIIKSVPLYSEMHRFIPAMLSVTGARLAQVKVRHHARQFGTSKYGLSRTYKVLIDLVTIKTLITSLARPMSWFGGIAVVHFLVAILLLAISPLFANTSLTVIFSVSMVIVSSGVFLMVCGILTELVYRTGNLKTHEFVGLRSGT